MASFQEGFRDTFRDSGGESERAFLNPEGKKVGEAAQPESAFLKDGARETVDSSKAFQVTEAVEAKASGKEGQLNENRENGERREQEVLEELKKQYPESEGHKVESEQYLRGKDGNIVKDPVTGEKRRVDFTVSKDGQVVKMVEVTSKTAPKDGQMAKEKRIREAGGNYIKDKDTGELKRVPDDVKTEVHRRD